jgi:hypothetical protein
MSGGAVPSCNTTLPLMKTGRDTAFDWGLVEGLVVMVELLPVGLFTLVVPVVGPLVGAF